MNLVQPLHSADPAPLAAALRRRDFAGAEVLSSALPPDATRLLADSMMRCRRWDDAAWLLGRVTGRTMSDDMKLRLARNFSALQDHRPGVYSVMVDAQPDNRFGIAASPSGPPTILGRREDGSVFSLSGSNDPADSARSIVNQLATKIAAGEGLAICGMGDGHLVAQLSAEKPKLFLSAEQALFILEPEKSILLLCLMIHDYTGPAGPIEQERVRWFVGPAWQRLLAEAVDHDPYLGLPATSISQQPTGPEAAEGLRAVTDRVLEADRKLAQSLTDYYSAVTPESIARNIRGEGNRRPRVLLLTTRFSTVLQFSTRDAASGFTQAGWDTQVVIEPSPSHRLFQPATRRAMSDFKPDIVFQIDHLRHEHNDLFPAGLPFVCWIQDHLPNLMNVAAGKRVGPLDFVLTDASSTYIRSYQYPPEQFISLAKLTRFDDRPAAPKKTGTGREISFVSNASHTTDGLIAMLHERFAADATENSLALAGAQRLIDLYSAGQSAHTYVDVANIVREEMAQSNIALPVESFHQVARWLCHPFNDALYRQQALRWAAAAAQEEGCTLSLYGAGWERHPEFAPYARGSVKYGKELADLTRQSDINLQIVPYLCLHQRLLDGLSAGGFFLVRKNLTDVAPQAMSDLLASHFAESVTTLDAARASAPPPIREKFERLVLECCRCLCSMGDEDPIQMVRDWEAAGLLVPGGEIVPQFSDIAFSNQQELRQHIQRFLADADAREKLVASQRASIESRLSYTAGMGRVGEAIAARLAAVTTSRPAVAQQGRAKAA